MIFTPSVSTMSREFYCSLFLETSRSRLRSPRGIVPRADLKLWVGSSALNVCASFGRHCWVLPGTDLLFDLHSMAGIYATKSGVSYAGLRIYCH